jgi:hypothetical protein
MASPRWRAREIVAAATLVCAPASAQALDGQFRGVYVCEKLPLTRDILRVPLDLVVHGDVAQFARPLFDFNGRVVGSELASGTIDASGKLHLTSRWSLLGNIADGDYSGTLAPAGGTLIGTQSWHAPHGGDVLARACMLALVPAPPTAARPD